MYLLIDELGIVRGKTSETLLVIPLKEALEDIGGFKITVCEVLSRGVHVYIR